LAEARLEDRIGAGDRGYWSIDQLPTAATIFHPKKKGTDGLSLVDDNRAR